MGMDVIGTDATNERGTYFNANVESWGALRTYCESVSPDLTGKVKHGQSNDGDGLNAEDSRALAEDLQAELDSGRTASYIWEREMYLALLRVCKVIGEKPCNQCQGKGTERRWDTYYSLSASTVQQFADFLRDCGEFEIH